MKVSRPPASLEELPMIKGLLWCFAVLALQLGLLRYVDIRVAAMPRLGDGPAIEPPVEPADVEAEASRLDA